MPTEQIDHSIVERRVQTNEIFDHEEKTGVQNPIGQFIGGDLGDRTAAFDRFHRPMVFLHQTAGEHPVVSEGRVTFSVARTRKGHF